MIKLNQIKIEYRELLAGMNSDLSDANAEKEFLLARAARMLGADRDLIHKFRIVRRSIDARHKPKIVYVYSVSFSYDDEDGLVKKNKNNKNMQQLPKEVLYEARLKRVRSSKEHSVVVVGSGPAGLFAAYALMLRGVKCTVIERGSAMEERVAEVERFWRDGVLNTESNVCFGEGGAGTFSDGKLNSGVKDTDGRRRFILEAFVRYGAGKDILYDAMPHIGTDVLRSVVVKLRKDMEKHGCTFLFNTKFTGIEFADEDTTATADDKSGKKGGGKSDEVADIADNQGGKIGRRIEGIWIERHTNSPQDDNSPFEEFETEKYLPADRLVLAIGHSATDTFHMLDESGFLLRAKPFAVGVRVQHRQEDIDRAQYGDAIDEMSLPAANYKLTGKTSDGRGVYSFCMCPGGYIVNSSTDTDGLVVNGMSNVGRDSGYANSAIVVSVEVENEEAFIGVEYLRKLEKSMYQIAEGEIPVQRYSDFREGLAESDDTAEGSENDMSDSENAGKSTGKKQSKTPLSQNQPAICGKWKYADVKSALPDDLTRGIVEGIEYFGSKIKGFDADDTLVAGLESRTSSPIRIVRGESLQSSRIEGVYPCGEGAGYAGGILSAAIDGLRVAEKLAETL